MINLEQALDLAEKHPIALENELLPLEEAMDRVLQEDIHSDRDVPPFSRATMDGFACRKQDLPGPLKVLESLPAGKVPEFSLSRNQCSQIMTGGMLPMGADCVIMQEYVKKNAEGRIFFTGSESESNIHRRAQDLKEGDLLLGKGTKLNASHLGIISSAGKTRVKVSAKLSIGLLATGSELIEADQVPSGAQIRNSNSPQLAGQVRCAGHRPVYLGIAEDEREKLKKRMSLAFEQVDLLILTGGASVGELDLVPPVLKELEFQLEFQRVAIQPGKPVSFAHRSNKICFGLSGNPVSSFVQFELLVRPYLDLCAGARPACNKIRLPLEEPFSRKHGERQFFLPVSFSPKGTCKPIEYHGSGHLHALAQATGFAEIPAGQTELRIGDIVDVRLF